jgi:hypothetical protein
LLKTDDSPPKILASQLFFLFDVKPHINSITDYMTVKNVLVAVGNILRSKQRLQEDVGEWARDLFKQAGLPFNVSVTTGSIDREENSVPLPGLSVVPSQPATPKTISPTPQKRRTRRVYLEFAVKLLARGSCTHRGLVDAIMKQYPALNRETVATFVSDVQNPKYSPIKDRKVVKQADGTLIFEDCVRPVLTVIENPNFAGTENEAEPVTEKQVSGGDV